MDAQLKSEILYEKNIMNGKDILRVFENDERMSKISKNEFLKMDVIDLTVYCGAAKSKSEIFYTLNGF